MRNKAASLAFGALLLGASGCLPGGEGAKSAGDAKSGNTLVASPPPAYEPPSTWRYSEPPTKDAAESSGLKDAVGPAPGGGPRDPGRAAFDGDTRALEEGGAPVPGAPGSGTPRKGGKGPLTAGPRKDTLTIAEPPAPGSEGGGALAASRKRGPGAPGTDGGAPRVDGGGGEGTAALAAPGSGANGSCPEGMAKVAGFCVDRYEGALVELSDGAEKPWSPYQPPSADRSYKAVSAAGRVPQGYISGHEADKACKAAGKRLCRAAEWLQACKGPSGTTYPYGAAYESRACNEHDRDAGYSSPIIRIFGKDLKWDGRQMNDPRINQAENGLAASGSYAKCTNAFGVFDMVGNLHEWIDDPAGTFQGGYYVDTYRNGNGCDYRTTAHPFKYHDYSTGFRCCADAK